MKAKLIEAPHVTIDSFDKKNPMMTVHNCINLKGKMVLNKSQAALLYVELHKFLLKK